MSSSNGVTITGTGVREVEVMAKPTRARAERAEALVELQKKGSEILGIELQRTGEKA